MIEKQIIHNGKVVFIGTESKCKEFLAKNMLENVEIKDSTYEDKYGFYAEKVYPEIKREIVYDLILAYGDIEALYNRDKHLDSVSLSFWDSHFVPLVSGLTNTEKVSLLKYIVIEAIKK